MPSKISWPDNKSFAFSIVDETDFGFLENLKPVYDFLLEKEIRTTKTVWVYPSRDKFLGDSLADPAYKDYMLYLQENGFELALHNVGSGRFTREEIIDGVEKFNEITGRYPRLQVNHSNVDNIYWGYKRFISPLSFLYKHVLKNNRFKGEEIESDCFWGDVCKRYIDYIPNFTFKTITSEADTYMPYITSKTEQFANAWFSTSFGFTYNSFLNLLSDNNLNKLDSNGGYLIIFTSFQKLFINEDTSLKQAFQERINKLRERNGWFVPASVLLDHIKAERKIKKLTYKEELKLNLEILKNKI